MKILKVVVSVLLLAISSSAWAFMPASGLWGIDSEMTGDPGRGFNIEVENEVVVFLYYGYREDRSSLFYIASGPIVNNVFSADLLTVQGGTPIGGAYRPGVETPLLGKVVLSFTSGKHGTITLPGENPKAISKYSFGYADGPAGLLGTWVFTQIVGGYPFAQRETLTLTTGTSTSTGNGLVSTAAYDFACEFQISGTFVGEVVCIDSPQTTGANSYAFKFSGDRGTGVSYYVRSTGGLSSAYESDAIRTATKTGARTGLNDGTENTVQIREAVVSPSSASSSIPAPDLMTVQAKESADASPTSSVDDPEKAAALAAWTDEVRALIPLKR